MQDFIKDRFNSKIHPRKLALAAEIDTVKFYKLLEDCGTARLMKKLELEVKTEELRKRLKSLME